MKSPVFTLLFRLLLLIAGILFVSAIFAPPIYVLIGYIAGENPWPYSRVYNRVAMVTAAVLIWVYRHQFKLVELWPELKSLLVGKKAYRLGMGFFLAFTSSLLLLPLIIADGDIVWSDASTGKIVYKLVKNIPAAFLIAVIEEFFFRYFLFYLVRQYMSFMGAALFSSLIYAPVHFIQPVKKWEFGEYSLTRGFEYLGVIFERYGEPGIIPAGVGLFLVGMVLCYTVERSKSLLPAIGLHAGWVGAMKMIGALIDRAPGFVYPSGAGRRYYILTHEVSWLSICLVGVLCSIFFVYRKKDAEETNGEE